MIREEYQAEGWQFPFVIYRPEEMSEDLPLVVQLHGAGEAGDGGEELWKADKSGFSRILSQGKEYHCIFVMPQLNDPPKMVYRSTETQVCHFQIYFGNLEKYLPKKAVCMVS